MNPIKASSNQLPSSAGSNKMYELINKKSKVKSVQDQNGYDILKEKGWLNRFHVKELGEVKPAKGYIPPEVEKIITANKNSNQPGNEPE